MTPPILRRSPRSPNSASTSTPDGSPASRSSPAGKFPSAPPRQFRQPTPPRSPACLPIVTSPPTELDALVPNLTPNFAPGPNNWLLLDELSLDPRDLCLALPRAARAAGVKLIENCPVLSVDAQSTGVLIETPMAPIAAATSSTAPAPGRNPLLSVPAAPAFLISLPAKGR